PGASRRTTGGLAGLAPGTRERRRNASLPAQSARAGGGGRRRHLGPEASGYRAVTRLGPGAHGGMPAPARALRTGRHRERRVTPEWTAPPAAERPPGLLPLLAVVLVMVVSVPPHAGSVAAWVIATVPLAAAWRLAIERGLLRPPGRIVRGIATFAVAFGVVYGYRGIAGVDAGSALLI